MPPQWVQQQVEYVLDEVTPYVVGERDTFEVNIQLSDRVEVALIEVKKLLRETDAYELLYDQVIAPEVKKRIGDGAELPFGVTITPDEVLDGLRRVAPPGWVSEQTEMVIGSAGPYLTGKTDSFTIEVSLVDNKREAEVVLAELADKKVTELIDSLPKCASVQEAAASLAGSLGGLPHVYTTRPAGHRADQPVRHRHTERSPAGCPGSDTGQHQLHRQPAPHHSRAGGGRREPGEGRPGAGNPQGRLDLHAG